MKPLQSRFAGGALVTLAVLSLAGCTYYHTTERTAPVVSRAPTVVRSQGPSAVVLPKDVSQDSETVIVAPDSTVTVTPRPND